jgi:uncharacterized LabA/DUF88 family protein
MCFRENNFAFIDSQNLNLGIRGLGWRLDFQKFRVYLEEKYDVSKAYLFLSYLPEYEKLYEKLRSYGYVLVFKPVVKLKNGTVKGNVDGELILQAMADYSDYDRAVIVSGDGDFHCLIDYLHERNKLMAILIPNESRCSQLLKAKPFKPYRKHINRLTNELRLLEEA